MNKSQASKIYKVSRPTIDKKIKDKVLPFIDGKLKKEDLDNLFGKVKISNNHPPKKEKKPLKKIEIKSHNNASSFFDCLEQSEYKIEEEEKKRIPKKQDEIVIDDDDLTGADVDFQFRKERANKEKELALLAKIKRQRLELKLVETKEVERIFYILGKSLSSAFDGFIKKEASNLAIETDIVVIENKLSEVYLNILEDFQTRFKADLKKSLEVKSET